MASLSEVNKAFSLKRALRVRGSRKPAAHGPNPYANRPPGPSYKEPPVRARPRLADNPNLGPSGPAGRPRPRAGTPGFGPPNVAPAPRPPGPRPRPKAGTPGFGPPGYVGKRDSSWKNISQHQTEARNHRRKARQAGNVAGTLGFGAAAALPFTGYKVKFDRHEDISWKPTKTTTGQPAWAAVPNKRAGKVKLSSIRPHGAGSKLVTGVAAAGLGAGGYAAYRQGRARHSERKIAELRRARAGRSGVGKSLVDVSKALGSQRFLSSAGRSAAKATAGAERRGASGAWEYAHTPASRGRLVTAGRRVADAVRGEPTASRATTARRRLADVTAENRKAALRGRPAPAKARADAAARRAEAQRRWDNPEWL